LRNFLVTVLAAALLASCAAGSRREEPSMPQPVPTPPGAPGTPLPDIAKVPDAVPRPESRSRRGNPPFYDVMGRRYFVLPSAENYVERGVASWYGPGFHAAQTSNGEPYDMYAMTAAHKTLPLPSYARVTNLRNGRSVVVRVNDRGPFVGNRIIDLSYTAAAKLDMLREGTALVEVRTVTATDEPSAVAQSGLYVQAGAFADESNARRLVERLHAAGVSGAFSRANADSRAPRLHRVRIGPVASVAEFDRLVARLAALGIRDARLALD
jgi:rare lipoprotein A